MSDHKMGHIQSFGIYLGVFISLLVLTLVTVKASEIHFESHLINEIVAMGIAGLKAGLVTLFFMHGKYEGKLTWAFIIYPSVLLAILFGGIFLDYLSRDLAKNPGNRADTGFVRQVPHIAVAKDPSAGHGAAGDHGAAPAGDHAAPAGDHGAAAPADHAPADHAAPAEAPAATETAPAEAPAATEAAPATEAPASTEAPAEAPAPAP